MKRTVMSTAVALFLAVPSIASASCYEDEISSGKYTARDNGQSAINLMMRCVPETSQLTEKCKKSNANADKCDFVVYGLVLNMLRQRGY